MVSEGLYDAQMGSGDIPTPGSSEELKSKHDYCPECRIYADVCPQCERVPKMCEGEKVNRTPTNTILVFAFLCNLYNSLSQNTNY